MIKKLFIANRGEIARRIIRTAHKLGIETVGIYTADEPNALWASEATEKVFLTGDNLIETYLNADKLILAALDSGCDALHPGYGFLSENADFAEKCEAHRLVFIGPDSETMRLMGDKLKARSFAKNAGVPVPFGFEGDFDTILNEASNMPFPVIIKASAGGGGKGMHIVNSPGELPDKLTRAQREAQNWFGNNTVYVEQYFAKARHIEVQILGDKHGNIIHLFERECSLQRNYQKIIEEAPSPTLNEAERNAICAAALKLAKKAQYTQAGTIEFLWSQGQFYFLEMNTRIQVEHPVTEAITGVDLIAEQIHIANNLPLNFGQKDIKINGVAIEARLYAEKPAENFKPSAGSIHHLAVPVSKSIRFDGAYACCDEVSSFYDGMLGKLIVHQSDRSSALQYLNQKLKQVAVHGIDTNLSFLSQLTANQNVINNNIYTRFLQNEFVFKEPNDIPEDKIPFLLAAFCVLSNQSKENDAKVWKKNTTYHSPKTYTLSINNQGFKFNAFQSGKELGMQWHSKMFNVSVIYLNNNLVKLVINGVEKKLQISQGKESFWIQLDECIFKIKSQHNLNQVQITKKQLAGEIAHNFSLTSPLHGKISKIMVTKGQMVEQGANILTIESMKTENHITSPGTGIVDDILIQTNALVKENQLLVTFKN